MTEETESKTANQSKGFSAQSILDLVERTFLAGMGAAALTKDRVQELVEDFVNRGQINAEESREVVDRLVARSREEARSVLKKADSSLHGAYRELGLTSKRDLEDLQVRVQQLEHRVRLLETGSDSGAPGEAGTPSGK
jgi:polyhydroxyalkanoate synthesis regulator phasin